MARLSQGAFTLRPKVARMWLSQFHAGGGGTGRDHMIPCSRLRSCWLTPAFPTHWIKSHTGFPLFRFKCVHHFNWTGLQFVLVVFCCLLFGWHYKASTTTSNNNNNKLFVCLFAELLGNFLSILYRDTDQVKKQKGATSSVSLLLSVSKIWCVWNFLTVSPSDIILLFILSFFLF